MKIAICQLNYTIADIIGNTEAIIQSVQRAREAGADLAVFSELSVCGYPPDDLLDYPHFIRLCDNAVEKIARASAGIAVIIGAPRKNPEDSGRQLYNAACLIENGKITDVIFKTLLPSYDVFNESRYFESNASFHSVNVSGKKIALTICEDLWHETEQFDYRINPLQELLSSSPDLIINISASPFQKGKKAERLQILRKQVETAGIPLFYVNQTGAHSDLIFDGCSWVIDRNGHVTHELKAFEEDFQVIDTDLPAIPLTLREEDEMASLHNALIYGISDYFAKNGFKTAVLGSSGGIDSAVVQCLASLALGPENVTALLMPSEFSSAGSVEDALSLSRNLGNPHHILPIAEINGTIGNTMKELFAGQKSGVAEENIQARARAILLMAYSNKFGNILLNTGNKSEMAVGYSTLYGDMCGSLSVIGDVFKTDVYRLANYINRNGEKIPDTIIKKAPSAELRPGQKDSDSLPPYDLLDAILKLYIEEFRSPEEIVEAGFEREMVFHTIRLVNRSEYKRFQAPPILRVSEKAFGRGRVMPLVSRW